jgi:hypothetical protein
MDAMRSRGVASGDGIWMATNLYQGAKLEERMTAGIFRKIKVSPFVIPWVIGYLVISSPSPPSRLR